MASEKGNWKSDWCDSQTDSSQSFSTMPSSQWSPMGIKFFLESATEELCSFFARSFISSHVPPLPEVPRMDELGNSNIWVKKVFTRFTGWWNKRRECRKFEIEISHKLSEPNYQFNWVRKCLTTSSRNCGDSQLCSLKFCVCTVLHQCFWYEFQALFEPMQLILSIFVLELLFVRENIHFDAHKRARKSSSCYVVINFGDELKNASSVQQSVINISLPGNCWQMNFCSMARNLIDLKLNFNNWVSEIKLFF